jgi:NAD(P)-dependent dehydrogenase (short-subunit alcohol dehydrogenase family)
MSNAAHTVLITGGTRGIGLEFVKRYLERGDRVIATARAPEKASGLRDLAGPKLRVVGLNVEDAGEIASLGGVIGDEPIDLLINNAGITSSSKTLAAMDAKELAQVFMVNTIAPMLVTRAVMGNLRAGTGRKLVHVTSQLGSIANNDGGSSYGYRASKAALNQMNRSLAAELGRETSEARHGVSGYPEEARHGVPGYPAAFTTIAIHPGWVRTDMGGPKADLSVEEAVGFMMKTIGGAGVKQSGAFLNYDGKVLPW